MKVDDIAVDKDTDYPEGIECVKTNLWTVWLEFYGQEQSHNNQQEITIYCYYSY